MRIGIYIGVFVALLVLTGVTVGLSYLHLAVAAGVAIAMAVALTKGTLVAAYFMHLIGEHRFIFLLLAITGIFFVVLLGAPILTALDDYRIK